jgi:thiamine biosynthesis lipoprotein
MPGEMEVAAALASVGYARLLLNRSDWTVGFQAPGVTVELGAIGKGYAIDCAVEVLREMEIECALIHAGTSTVYGLGAPEATDGWTVAIRDPAGAEDDAVAEVILNDRALSVSAPHGKFFDHDGERFGHVLDPRTGYPVRRCALAAVVAKSAADSDALSTALLVRGGTFVQELLALDGVSQAIAI